MIKSHQTTVAGGDKKYFAEYKHVTQKLNSQDPLIYFFSFFSLLFFVVIVVMTISFD